ncbi:alpha/beta hydrolase [Actinorugispora endophytica]|uniref:Alpha/beta hydrolase family protein n=1 Tax=Actinorugispora endophytica TaxID=1605990 RepID=A0A4V3D973_9ACTN|nr:alpha/beta hydrolase [Actinorugispora endophytica]TDQ54970.1 alpha/beta hydrolase family protein [Actinorugispora endophytica]
MKTTGWITGALAVVLVAAGCSGEGAGGPGASADPLSAFHTQEIDWEDCGGGFECGAYEVPMDYEDPDGRRLEIAVKRLPASGADRIGSLLVNPGGPGGSGVEYVGAAHGVISEQVRERFDVVGFDPRGVGRSNPLYCLETEELDDFLGLEMDSEDGDGDPTEVTDEGLAELEEANRGFVQACQDRSGDLLAHVGTADVARDMDVLRAVLGDDKLTYLGKSYGTSIGTYYAELFPRNVRALVLDGAVDPEGDQLEISVEQAGGFTTALNAFVGDCLALPDCPLSDGPDTTVEEGVDRIGELLEQAAREPLENRADDREVNRPRTEMGVLAALYSESFWPDVRAGLADAIDSGDGTALLQLGDMLYARKNRDEYENSTAVLVAVNCADRESPRDIAVYEEAARTAAETSPLFGPTLAWGALTCAYWPEEAVAEPIELDGDGAPPILVVGTTRDSATPYQWSEDLAAALDTGVLLTWEGDGHTAYRSGDDCVDQAVDTYLLETTAPAEGTVCDLP